jgi:F0F1-type ATP synthase membrane subunit b/b'
MSAAQLLVTIAGLLLIVWVLWYFLVPPRRGGAA